MKVLLFFLLLSLLNFPISNGYNFDKDVAKSETVFGKDLVAQGSPRVLLPVYVRLQALQKSNITFWESVPRNFTDHVATIDSRVLAMFVSSNSLGFKISRDNVGNLWVAANYSLNAGDYISTLTWVSSKAISENLTSLGFVPFPENYPEDVKAFLEPGRKIPAQNQIIQEIAASHNQTQNMTQTVKNILDFVNEQGYDPEKTRLLLSGNLNTTNIFDFFKDALQVHETNSSICLERSWYAAAILRAAGVPTRTVTDIRLKTWIQAWLPNTGWVDGETLCVEPPPHIGMLPKSISTSAPWMVENSSDAMFPFVWFPEVPMRVANLTFSNVELFEVNEYRTVLSEPVDTELFKKDPAKFSFPIAFKPEKIVYAAITQEGSDLTFSLIEGKENASKMLTLGESNSVTLGDLTVSFKPIKQEDFLVLQDFTVGEIWKFDVRFLVPIVGVPIVVVAVWLYWKRRKHSR